MRKSDLYMFSRIFRLKTFRILCQNYALSRSGSGATDYNRPEKMWRKYCVNIGNTIREYAPAADKYEDEV